MIILYFHNSIDAWNNFGSNRVAFEKKLNDMNLCFKEQGGTGFNIMYREISPIQKRDLLEGAEAAWL